MIYKYSYAYHKLYEVVEMFVTSNKSARDKIADSFLVLHVLKEDDFPDKAKASWRFYREKISEKSAPPGYDPKNKQGRVYWTTRQMHWRTMRKIQECIWSMFSTMTLERIA
jgi:hypothetical protein